MHGKVKVGEIRSQGELAGEFDADVVAALGHDEGQHGHPRQVARGEAHLRRTARCRSSSASASSRSAASSRRRPRTRSRRRRTGASGLRPRCRRRPRRTRTARPSPDAPEVPRHGVRCGRRDRRIALARVRSGRRRVFVQRRHRRSRRRPRLSAARGRARALRGGAHPPTGARWALRRRRPGHAADARGRRREDGPRVAGAGRRDGVPSERALRGAGRAHRGGHPDGGGGRGMGRGDARAGPLRSHRGGRVHARPSRRLLRRTPRRDRPRPGVRRARPR